MIALVRRKSFTYDVPAHRRIFRLAHNGRVVAVPLGLGLEFEVLTDAEDLIKAEGYRLKECFKCRKIFVAVKRQAYCSTGCSQKARTERYLDRHGKEEQSDKRHRRYKKKMQDKIGKGAAVVRRRRFGST